MHSVRVIIIITLSLFSVLQIIPIDLIKHVVVLATIPSRGRTAPMRTNLLFLLINALLLVMLIPCFGLH